MVGRVGGTVAGRTDGLTVGRTGRPVGRQIESGSSLRAAARREGEPTDAWRSVGQRRIGGRTVGRLDVAVGRAARRSGRSMRALALLGGGGGKLDTQMRAKISCHVHATQMRGTSVVSMTISNQRSSLSARAPLGKCAGCVRL